MTLAQQTGCIFNMQKFSVHDGPGIRTIVFLKGCPLRCWWCSNPESQNFYPELALDKKKCIGFAECAFCQQSCQQGAVQNASANAEPMLVRNLCHNCFTCAQNCPTGALHVFGEKRTVAEILEIVEADSVFYSRSGGGLTVSGGEPLAQPAFTKSLLQAAQQRRIDTAMETSGYAPWPVLEEICRHLDSIIYDLKCLDSRQHKKGTGFSNQLIVENFNKLCNNFPDLPKLVRTPIIPGFNDEKEMIVDLLVFLRGRENIKYELLPYHRFGQSKYQALGREYSLGERSLKESKLLALRELAAADGWG